MNTTEKGSPIFDDANIDAVLGEKIIDRARAADDTDKVDTSCAARQRPPRYGSSSRPGAHRTAPSCCSRFWIAAAIVLVGIAVAWHLLGTSLPAMKKRLRTFFNLR
jgi:hypothetical protein